MWNSGWDKIFEENEWGRYPPEELVRFVARNFYNVPDRRAVRALEVGSGTGANLWYLAREGFDVTGIDGSTAGAKRAIKRLADEGLEADVKVGDIMSLPFEDNMFDCVIDNECIYANSYKDSKKIMDEIFRVLKPNGKFYSRTFATGTYGDGNGRRLEGEKNTYLEIYSGALRKGYGTIRFTDKDEIRDLYGKFVIESIDYVIRSVKGGAHEIKEWIIISCKADKTCG